LDDHVRKIIPSEWIILYLDKLFQEVVIEWLISTNQSIQAIDYLSFRNMIEIVSCATKGVIVLNHKTTHAEIISIFKRQMSHLKEHLNASNLFLTI
ncbi:hypothetical protein F5I97DRAFT_1792655, partial [Phlebopus sp. FC_14]